jgi:hypothetical protein
LKCHAFGRDRGFERKYSQGFVMVWNAPDIGDADDYIYFALAGTKQVSAKYPAAAAMGG